MSAKYLCLTATCLTLSFCALSQTKLGDTVKVDKAVICLDRNDAITLYMDSRYLDSLQNVVSIQEGVIYDQRLAIGALNDRVNIKDETIRNNNLVVSNLTAQSNAYKGAYQSMEKQYKRSVRGTRFWRTVSGLLAGAVVYSVIHSKL